MPILVLSTSVRYAFNELSAPEVFGYVFSSQMYLDEVCGSHFFERRRGGTAEAPSVRPRYPAVWHRCASEELCNLSLLCSMFDLMKEFLMKDLFCTVTELLILSESRAQSLQKWHLNNSLFAFPAPRCHSQEQLFI